MVKLVFNWSILIGREDVGGDLGKEIVRIKYWVVTYKLCLVFIEYNIKLGKRVLGSGEMKFK